MIKLALHFKNTAIMKIPILPNCFFGWEGGSFGGKLWEVSLISSRGNRSQGLSGTRKMDLGCEKPRLPRAALDSAIWRCQLQKPVKFAQLGAN